jgi:AcrR family transcriptional regulator
MASRSTVLRGANTRATILGAAVELGSMRGLEYLSMGGLASTVEMSKSGLFAHFGSKEELQLATVARAWEIFQAEVLPEPRLEAGLGGLLERWLSFFERGVFPGGCFFVVSAVEFAALDGAVRDALAEALERQIGALEEAVDAANATGELPTPRDPRATAFALHALLTNANSLFIVQNDPRVFDQARAVIGDLLRERRLPRERTAVRPA